MWMVLHRRPPISPCPRCVQAVKVQLMMVAAAHYISYTGRGTKVYCDCRESGCWAGWIINVRGSAIILGVVILSTTLELPTLQDIKHNNTDTATVLCSSLLHARQHERKHASALTALPSSSRVCRDGRLLLQSATLNNAIESIKKTNCPSHR